MNIQHAKLLKAMIAYDRGDAMRIHHLLKVHDLAALIGALEGLDDETQFILETAAIVHDIGIHKSEEKYGSSNGKYQEREGPGEAQGLLQEVGGYTEGQIDRVCYLVGHHHTYDNINGMDYQILVDADFLVNIYEDGLSEQAVRNVREKIFKTQAGINLLENIYQ
jgi:HD superfamily phosphodiesterase